MASWSSTAIRFHRGFQRWVVAMLLYGRSMVGSFFRRSPEDCTNSWLKVQSVLSVPIKDTWVVFSEALHSIDHEVISNMFLVDPRAFVRKHSALLNGISSILFIPHPSGVLLELGFSKPDDAQDSLPFLLTSHALSMEQCVLAERPGGLSLSQKHRKNAVAIRARSPSPEPAQSNSWWPSIGSQGHPICCQLPCKYVRKRKGCKDGVNCTRCHLCGFSKSGERHRFKLEYSFKARAIATTLSAMQVATPDYLGPTWAPLDEDYSGKSF